MSSGVIIDSAVHRSAVAGDGARAPHAGEALDVAQAADEYEQQLWGVVLVLVSGPAKASAVAATLHGALDPDRWPAQRLREGGARVVWLLDRAAAPRKD
jgi:hypothetical protein